MDTNHGPPDGHKRVILNMPEPLHNRLMREAARSRRTKTAILIIALLNYLKITHKNNT